MSNYVTINLNKVSFQLKKAQDFEWLKAMGDIFCVFDQQDSTSD
jgi:serine/threonine protein kinase, bacterial